MALVKIEGIREMARAFRKLSDDAQNKIAKAATTTAAQPVLADARAQAPGLTGQVKRSLRVSTRKRRGGGGYTSRVQSSKGDYQGDDFYASFITYGTKERFTRSGRSTGRIDPPRNFMRAAFDANVRRCIDVMADQFRRGIEAACK
jgi:HK97 gp10 family phage protein